jgi:hypothetical protein
MTRPANASATITASTTGLIFCLSLNAPLALTDTKQFNGQAA